MHRIGGFFSRLGGGNTVVYEQSPGTLPNCSSGHKAVDVVAAVAAAAAQEFHQQQMVSQQNQVVGRISEINDSKRRAVSTDSSGYHFGKSSFGQAPGNRLSRSRSIVANNSVEDYVKRTKKSAAYLKLLLHSRKCGGQCRMPNCIQTSRVLQHVSTCTAPAAGCGFPGCHTTKKLIRHYEECSTSRAAAAQEAARRKTITSFSYSPPSPFMLHQQQQDDLQQQPRLREAATEAVAFCLLCSMVSTSNPGSPNSHHQEQPPRDSLSDDSQRGDDSEDATPDSSLIVFDEIIEFNKVPFKESAPYSHSSYSSPSCNCPLHATPGSSIAPASTIPGSAFASSNSIQCSAGERSSSSFIYGVSSAGGGDSAASQTIPSHGSPVEEPSERMRWFSADSAGYSAAFPTTFSPVTMASASAAATDNASHGMYPAGSSMSSASASGSSCDLRLHPIAFGAGLSASASGDDYGAMDVEDCGAVGAGPGEPRRKIRSKSLPPALAGT